MALIDRGKVVYEGGFGLRELGKPEPVDKTRCSWLRPTPRDDDPAPRRTR
jgi:hypothetical protein